VGGVLLLPWHPGWAPLRWLGPVFGARLYDAHLSTSAQWILGVMDTVVAVIGLAVAMPLWTTRPERPELEPAVLQRSYYLDDLYDALIGRPGQSLARFLLVVVDNRVIDGAVNGVGRAARLTGTGLRRVQTGFVRQYALGIVVGAVGLLAFMVARAWA
jgi:NADH-quinone oxidoreductase subunit L